MEPNYDQRKMMLFMSSFALLLLSSPELINADFLSSISSFMGGGSPGPSPKADFVFPDQSGPDSISEPPASTTGAPTLAPTGSIGSTPTKPTAQTPSSSLSPSATPAPTPTPNPTVALTPSLSPSAAGPISANPKVEMYIKKICDSTDYPSLCMTQFTSLVGDNVDPTSLLTMATNSVIAKVNLALESATAFLAEASTKNPEIAGPLKDCKDTYEDAVDNLKKALTAVQNKDIDTANTMLSGAITDFTTCSDGFTSGKNPMMQYSANLTDLVGNCLEIASMVKKQP